MAQDINKVSKAKLREVHKTILDIDKRALELEKELYPNIKNLLKKISKQFTSIFDVNNIYNTTQIYNFVKNYESELIALYRMGFEMANDEFGYDLRKKLLNKRQINDILQKTVLYSVEDKDITEMDKNYYKEWVLFENNQSEIEVGFLLNTLTQEIDSTIKKAQKDTTLYFENLDSDIIELLNKINSIENNIAVYADKGAKLKEYKTKLQNLQQTREEQRNQINTIIFTAFATNIDKTFINHAKQLADTIINTGEAKARNLEAQTIKKHNGTLKKKDKIYEFSEIIENAFWVSMGDNRVRITHAVANGQLKQNDSYIVGGYICSHPRDPILPIGERIRCRCREYFGLK